jgi:8-amino-7-oxononanoate synthase
LAAELGALEDCGRLRNLPDVGGLSRVEPTIGDTSLVSFCSNDYLGLASHPDLADAAAQAARRSGFGAAASRLVSGNLPEHTALELNLASFVGLPAALLFPSGYQANTGVLSALASPSDLIVADRDVHASLIDGCRLSGAKLAFYPHLRADQAERHLRHFGAAPRRRFIVTESVFSMDGEVAPLEELSRLARAHGAALLVDEAHALGALGPGGSGLCAQLSLAPDILVGTLGKAFGCSGAFVAGSTVLRHYLLNRARTFVFTTAMPPPVAAAALRSLAIIASPEGDGLRARLASNVSQLRSLLDLHLPARPVASPILPIILGTDRTTVRASAYLREHGFFVQAIRPPSVREGTARLRLTVSAAHTPDHLSRLAFVLRPVLPESLPLACPPTARTPPAQQVKQVTQPALRRGIFIVGTDTGVGKTAVATALSAALADRGLAPVPFKPVETGADPYPADAARLRDAARRAEIPLSIICPIPLRQPIAPAAAARLEQAQISLPILQQHLTVASTQGDFLVVEAAGGLLTPYAPGLTGADLAQAFGLPLLLVARNSLGTVNHTALAVTEIRRRALPLLGVILVNTSRTTTPDQPHNSELIADIAGLAPLGTLAFLSHPTPASLAAELGRVVDLERLFERCRARC